MTQKNVTRNYKDSLFRMIFSDENELLALYNAMNGSHYTDPKLLVIKTLDNAIYLNIKNDVSFLIDNRLNLYEHQSTYNPNIPLRDLFYVADQLQEIVKDEDIYKTTLIKIPTPEFVVFYNGTREQPDRKMLQLSDSFEVPADEVKLELLVTMLNINIGHNQELMAQCKTLRDYSLYVEKVRAYTKTMLLEEAVERAVNECIQDDILKKFLLKQKAEAIKVTIYEYDEALHEKTLREEGREEGELRKVIEIIQKKLSKGMNVTTIAEHLEESVDFVEKVVTVIHDNPSAGTGEILEMVKTL